ncbi:MAG: dTDP-4-dehydrorhamnose reductase [Candidatus Xenobia bacterium]
MKVLLTGADGLLGQDVRATLESSNEFLALGKSGLDVTNIEKVFDIVARIKPDVVIHCAANNDIEACEASPVDAFHVNAMGTHNVALACLEHRAAMLYVSCDAVFDGASAVPYWEYDYPNPPSVYGKSKLAGERAVSDHLGKYWILRTGPLFGKGRDNFVSQVLNCGAGNVEVQAVSDQVFNPSYTTDLAHAIKDIIKSPFYGTYHVTNEGACTWAEFAREILDAANYETIEVVPVSNQPGSTVLNNSLYQLRGFTPLRTWQEALHSYLKDLGLLASRV